MMHQGQAAKASVSRGSELPEAAKLEVGALLTAAMKNDFLLSDLEGDAAVGAFESALASTLGTSFAMAVSSGTSALQAAMLAGDVAPGDEVIVSPYGWGQTVAAVLSVGATPVFADIEIESGNLDPQAVRAVISPRTRAVLVTHVFGCPANMTGLRILCREHNLLLVADAAQALGARLFEKPVASWADVTCFSFGRGKLITTGEGGALLTDDAELYERAILVSQHPLRAFRDIEDPELRRSVSEFGFTFRMSPLLAIIGRTQIPLIESRVAHRVGIGKALSRKLAGVPDIARPVTRPCLVNTLYRYVARWTGEPCERHLMIEQLCRLGISASCDPIPDLLSQRFPFTLSTGSWYPKAMSFGAPHSSWEPAACPVALRRVQQDICIAMC